MALFDKINTIAKNVGEKTGEAIEITKLNAKISGEKSAIADLYKQLGEKIYASAGTLCKAGYVFCYVNDDGIREDIVIPFETLEKLNETTEE